MSVGFRQIESAMQNGIDEKSKIYSWACKDARVLKKT
jgi:hypothetical protein